MIKEFQGEYRWLSNFVPVVVTLEGVKYPSVENAYQAAKTLDLELRKEFENCSASNAKFLGNKLKLEKKIRKDWRSVKKQKMYNLLDQKFHQEPYISLLMDTQDKHIQEGNRWGDTYWGVDLRTGTGHNHLGKLIMSIRQDLLFWEDIIICKNQTEK